MEIKRIDLENWERREFYEHFIKEVVCSFSLTVNVDITALKGQKLYPAMIWLLTRTVNDMEAFRTCLTPEGPGIYPSMHPMYTIFNKENKNFSGIWSYFDADYGKFLQNYQEDTERYSHSTRYAPKEGTPENAFNISMVPWFSFTSVNMNVYDEGKFLLPIFTMGKSFEQEGKRLLPLAIQVHHAVCDAYHVGQFLEKLQAYIEKFPN